jgi:Phage MuF-C-terminal domain
MPAQPIITVTEDFHSVLRAWESNGYSANVIFNLGITSQAMQEVGAKPLPILVTGGTLSKAFFNHGIILRTLGELPKWLDSPVQVYRSATVTKGSVVVLTPSLRQGEPIIVPIELDAEIDRFPTNRIKSVYSKPLFVVENWEKQGLRIK